MNNFCSVKPLFQSNSLTSVGKYKTSKHRTKVEQRHVYTNMSRISVRFQTFLRLRVYRAYVYAHGCKMSQPDHGSGPPPRTSDVRSRIHLYSGGGGRFVGTTRPLGRYAWCWRVPPSTLFCYRRIARAIMWFSFALVVPVERERIRETLILCTSSWDERLDVGTPRLRRIYELCAKNSKSARATIRARMLDEKWLKCFLPARWSTSYSFERRSKRSAVNRTVRA